MSFLTYLIARLGSRNYFNSRRRTSPSGASGLVKKKNTLLVVGKRVEVYFWNIVIISQKAINKQLNYRRSRINFTTPTTSFCPSRLITKFPAFSWWKRNTSIPANTLHLGQLERKAFVNNFGLTCDYVEFIKYYA